MKVLFIGSTGIHHALMAAHIFLEKNADSHLVWPPHFADLQIEKKGHPLLVGTKNDGSQVYVLGVGREVKMAKKSLTDLRNIWGFNQSNLAIIPIRIKGEGLISLLAKLPNSLSRVHKLVVKVIIKGQIGEIAEQAKLDID